MRFRLSPATILLTATLVVFGYAVRAEAGFLTIELSDVLENTAPAESMTPVGDDSDSPAPSVDRPVVELVTQSGTTLAGSPPSVTSSSPGGSIALIESEQLLCGQALLAYQLAESALLLRVPFLDGIFRPPRAIFS